MGNSESIFMERFMEKLFYGKFREERFLFNNFQVNFDQVSTEVLYRTNIE